jgi:hypothetical protein
MGWRHEGDKGKLAVATRRLDVLAPWQAPWLWQHQRTILYSVNSDIIQVTTVTILETIFIPLVS